jgi:hypothetical protein
MRRPTEDPCARPAIATLERLHMELGGKLLEKPPDGSGIGRANAPHRSRHQDAGPTFKPLPGSP